MTQPIDTQKVWTALSADPKFLADIHSGAHPVFRELVEHVPRTLAPLADDPLTLLSFGGAKVGVFRLTLEIGFFEKLVEKLPKDAFTILDRKSTARLLRLRTSKRLRKYERICRDVVGWLRRHNTDEPTFMAHPEGGRLNESSMELYRAGGMTIRSLLKVQPSAIIHASS